MKKQEITEPIDLCAAWIAASRNLVIFTGAGISTDSGLPDYRGPDGVWTRRDKGLAPPVQKKPIEQVEPNAGHMALVKLQEQGLLRFLISQNVDNLHRKSGINPALLAELHGNCNLLKCLRCDGRLTKEEAGWDEKKWGKGYRTDKPVDGQPRCRCGGRLISSIVNFGDPMPRKEMELARHFSRQADLFIVIGSSLVVSPANEFPGLAVRAGGKLVIINKGTTPLDSMAALCFNEEIGVVLPKIVQKAVASAAS